MNYVNRAETYGQKLFISKKWTHNYLDSRGGWFHMAESYRDDMIGDSGCGLMKGHNYPQFIYAVKKAKQLTVYGE